MFAGEALTGVKTRPQFLPANHCVFPHLDADSSSESMDDPPAPSKIANTTSQALSKDQIHRRTIFVYNDFQTGFTRMIPPTFLAFGALFESGNLNRVEASERLELNNSIFQKRFHEPAMAANVRDTIQTSGPFTEGTNAQKTTKVTDHSEITQEYFLKLSNDVNTRGHVQWFHFAVGNTRVNWIGETGLRNSLKVSHEVFWCSVILATISQTDVTYRFHIGNFTKRNSQFQTGMRPWMYSVKETGMELSLLI